MIKLPDVNTVYFDVDDTLVLHHESVTSEVLEAKGIRVPVHRKLNGEVYYEFFVVPHLPHIQMLKEVKASGKVVVVWSQGGSDWAESVIKALNLEEYVDLCVCKPHWFVDDLMTFMFMPESCRIYKKYDGSQDTPPQD